MLQRIRKIEMLDCLAVLVEVVMRLPEGEMQRDALELAATGLCQQFLHAP